jgi:adenylosuccinate synthase
MLEEVLDLVRAQSRRTASASFTDSSLLWQRRKQPKILGGEDLINLRTLVGRLEADRANSSLEPQARSELERDFLEEYTTVTSVSDTFTEVGALIMNRARRVYHRIENLRERGKLAAWLQESLPTLETELTLGIQSTDTQALRQAVSDYYMMLADSVGQAGSPSETAILERARRVLEKVSSSPNDKDHK